VFTLQTTLIFDGHEPTAILFRGLAASSHDHRNRRQLIEISYIARVRKNT
jgi:hypothetical protein